MDTSLTKEQKLDEIKQRLDATIAAIENDAESAMKTLELMNPTPEQYKRASAALMRSTYVVCYLKRVMDVATSGDFKKTENVFRFHAYQLRTKGCNQSDGIIAKAQNVLANILVDFVNQFFEV